MSQKQEVIFDTTGLDKLKDALSANSYAKVGIFGSNVSRDDDSGLSNVDIGVVQELGSITRNIPARSFLRMPIMHKAPQVLKFIQSKTMRELILGGKLVQALTLLGVYGETIVQEAFESRGFGQWAPNSPVTVKRKKSDKPLIDTSQLRRGVSSEVMSE